MRRIQLLITLSAAIVSTSVAAAIPYQPMMAGAIDPAVIAPFYSGPGAQANPSVPVNPAAVASLGASIRTALAALPANATNADAQAAIVYAIDQSGQPISVVLATLKTLDASVFSNSAGRALASVRSNRTQLGERGTGSIAGGASIGFASGPALTVSGGSDYTPSPR